MTNKTYTEEQLQEAVINSNSIRQVLLALNLSPKGGGGYRSIIKAIKDGGLNCSHFTGQSSNKGKRFAPKRNLEDYLSNKSPIESHPLKLRLLKDNVFNHECSSCKLQEWLSQPIPLELDHKDGNHYNNELSNLRLLCPNCHAQTPNHCSKQRKKEKFKLIKKEKRKCIDCLSYVYRQSIRCRKCNNNKKSRHGGT